jgi:hypothetical protein
MFLDASNQCRLVPLSMITVSTRKPTSCRRDLRGQAAYFCLLAELDDGLALPCAGEEDSGDKGPLLNGGESARETRQVHEASRADASSVAGGGVPKGADDELVVVGGGDGPR